MASPQKTSRSRARSSTREQTIIATHAPRAGFDEQRLELVSELLEIELSYLAFPVLMVSKPKIQPFGQQPLPEDVVARDLVQCVVATKNYVNRNEPSLPMLPFKNAGQVSESGVVQYANPSDQRTASHEPGCGELPGGLIWWRFKRDDASIDQRQEFVDSLS